MFLFQSVWSFKNWPRQPIWSVMTEYGREGCVELSSHCAQSLHICPKGNAQTSYVGGNTVSETFTPMFLSWSVWSFKNWPRQSIWSVMAYLPIVPKASIYVPKVMPKPVMGGNTVSETFTPMFFYLEVYEVSKSGPDSQFGAWWLSMGGKGVLNYIFPLCPTPPYTSQR